MLSTVLILLVMTFVDLQMIPLFYIILNQWLDWEKIIKVYMYRQPF